MGNQGLLEVSRLEGILPKLVAERERDIPWNPAKS